MFWDNFAPLFAMQHTSYTVNRKPLTSLTLFMSCLLEVLSQVHSFLAGHLNCFTPTILHASPVSFFTELIFASWHAPKYTALYSRVTVDNDLPDHTGKYFNIFLLSSRIWPPLLHSTVHQDLHQSLQLA